MKLWCDISAIVATDVENRTVWAAVGKVNSMPARPSTSIPQSVTFMRVPHTLLYLYPPIIITSNIQVYAFSSALFPIS